MDRERFRRFWEKKARFYPRPFEDRIFAQTKGILERLRSNGISFRGKKILDIGCGTGIYTLPLAREAEFVLGIDCSFEMLKILREEANRKGIKNVETLNLFFEELDVCKQGLKEEFDIVMAMMTPAIKSREDLVKMEECGKSWFIYMGWVKDRSNPILDLVFSLHDIKVDGFLGALKICMILNALKRRFHFESFQIFWDFKGTLEDATEDLAQYVELYGKKPKRELIISVLKKEEKDGFVEHRTFAEVGLILWKKAERM